MPKLLTVPTKTTSRRAKEVSSPERLLDILLMFSLNEVVTVQEIAERFGGSRSSTYRDIGFLKARDFVEELDASGAYRLGAGIARLASSDGYLNRLKAIAEPHLGVLADNTQESVLMCRCIGSRVSLVVGLESRLPLRVSIEAADRQPLYRGSFGKVLMAYQRKSVIDSLLVQAQVALPPATQFDPMRLRQELKSIRQSGFAISDSEIESGTRSVSAPVRHGKEIIASISVAGPTARMPDHRIKDLCDELFRTAQRIADDLYGESQASGSL